MAKEIYKLGLVLGRDEAISTAEVFAVLRRENIQFTVELQTKGILIVSSTDKKLNDVAVDEFGGVIKTFEIVGSGLTRETAANAIRELKPAQTEQRINFGFSVYGNVRKEFVYDLGKKLKDSFVDSGFPARFVTGRDKDLSSVIVHENKLIERGFEALIIESQNVFTIGRTKEVQDYKFYSKIDYGRPDRDEKSGMLPPKLAKIMINLSEIPKSKVLYDPFCGSGTILEMANLGGFEQIFGSDISEKAVDDSKRNLVWLEQKLCAKPIPEERIFVSDVLNPTRKVEANAIVGEGYLGEPIRRNKEQAAKDVQTLASFYLEALENLTKMLKPNGRIVLAVPFYIAGGGYFYLPILAKLNLKVIKPEIGLRLPGRGNLTYARKDQFVGREILILEKI